MVQDVREEGGHVVAAEVEEEAAEGECGEGFKEVECDEAGEVAACGLGGC